MKLDKFSFAVGIAFVLAILGCIGAVTIEDSGRYDWEVSLEQPKFFVLDRDTGTVNEVDRNTQVVRVFRFRQQ